MDPGLSLSDLRTAWKVLNVACFGGMLKEPWLTYGPSDCPDPVCGLYYPPALGGPRIHIDSRCTTLESVMTTMAHEMVHQLQEVEAKPTNHGNYFRSWAAKIKRQTGITI